jgi:hypothetical protein
MARALAQTPRVHVTFNPTPVLLEQLDAIGAGRSDPADAARRPPCPHRGADVVPFARFDVNSRRAEPVPALPGALRAEGSGRGVTPDDLRDLQVWFHLAWADPFARSSCPPARGEGEGIHGGGEGTVLEGLACARDAASDYREAAARTGADHVRTPPDPRSSSTPWPREASPSATLPDPPFRSPEDAAEQIARARGVAPGAIRRRAQGNLATGRSGERCGTLRARA